MPGTGRKQQSLILFYGPLKDTIGKIKKKGGRQGGERKKEDNNPAAAVSVCLLFLPPPSATRLSAEGSVLRLENDDGG